MEGIVVVARVMNTESSLVCSTHAGRSRFTEADSGGSSFFPAERGYVHLFV